MSPFTPHLAEELWHLYGNMSLVVKESWPTVNQSYINNEAELTMYYIERVLEDIQHISRVLRKKLSKVVIYVVPENEYNVFLKLISLVSEGKTMKDVMRVVLSEIKDKEVRKILANKMNKLYNIVLEIPPNVRELILKCTINEYTMIINMINYIRKKVNVEEIEVYYSNDPKAPDYGGKKSLALPFKPAIYVS